MSEEESHARVDSAKNQDRAVLKESQAGVETGGKLCRRHQIHAGKPFTNATACWFTRKETAREESTHSWPDNPSTNEIFLGFTNNFGYFNEVDFSNG